jgi:hypothetical protein
MQHGDVHWRSPILVLVALCLTWTCVGRISAQAPNPPSSHIGPQPTNHGNVSETDAAAHSGRSPFEGLQLFDGVSPTAGKTAQAAPSLFDGFEFPYDGIRPGAGASSLDIVGNPAAGGESATAAMSGSDDQSDEKSNKCPAPPAYKLLRYDEDYSYLKDPSCRTDFWDPIKYIPLWGRDDWYLSIGGSARERYEFIHEQNAGAVPPNAQDNGYLLERYLLHGDLHLGPYFRFFGEFQSGLEDGRIGGPRPGIDRDPFAVHQAFVDFVLPLAGDKDTLTARLGRQEFEYGSGRLIDVRDGTNLRLSFDAARLLLHAGDWEVDGWWGKPVRNQPGVFDDDPDPTHSFWGLYAVHPLPLLPKGNVDLYYLGFENKDAVYVQGAGYELRHTLGTRIWGRPLPWEYNLEYDWQFGTFGPGNIEAWSVAHAIRYNFSDLPLKPRLGLRFDVASGDNNPASANLQTFNPLFPSGMYFSLLNPVGPLNMIDLHPTLDLYAGEKLTVSLDCDFFWRESLGDGVYTISGMPLRPGFGSARFVGTSPAITVVWNPTRHISLLASYVHFAPGPFFRDNPPDKATDYFTTWLNYEF